MSKYDPLTHHLSQSGRAKVAMTFAQIEHVLGFRLPPSSRKHRAWWSNNPTNSVMTRAWLEAGYQSREVDLEEERLVFAKLNEVAKEERRQGDHPLWGAMKGTVLANPDAAPTAPIFTDAEMEKFVSDLARLVSEGRN
jgi:hypothetical protein